MGTDRAEPGGRRDTATAAPAGGRPADGRAGAGADRRRACATIPDFATYLWVLAATGCRRGEACALRWTDVDLERGEVAIRRSISQVGGELREKDTKTHQSRRMAIDEGTVEVLRTHRLRQRELALALGESLADDALLFSDVEGRPWRPDVCTNRFGRLRASLGLERVRLHDLRHFVASVLGDGGVPIATISSRLGHRDIATTLNLYTHALPATDQRAAAYLGDLLSGKRSPDCRRSSITLSAAANRQVRRAHIDRFPFGQPADLPRDLPFAARDHGACWTRWTRRARSAWRLRGPT